MTEATDPRERFSQRAEPYDRGRPGYPAELYTWYRARFRLQAESVVADVGAGTGLHTEGLAGIVGRVWAVEPNDRMRDQARERFRGATSVRVSPGSAEHMGLPDASVDLVTAAQAFHWFQPPSFAREVRRVLRRPDSWCLVWNVRNPAGNAFTAGYEEILHRFGNGYAAIRESWGDPDRIAEFYGGDVDRRVLPNRQAFDFDGVEANMASSSYMPSVGAEGWDPARAALDALFRRESHGGLIELAYETLVVTPRR
ncbi:MAG: class I SAM-dependent methyltransferase [Gemmatimonadota bacterium]|nr:class I SAM-dependent methyltransferase [Gemmatimonadota bacterium]